MHDGMEPGVTPQASCDDVWWCVFAPEGGLSGGLTSRSLCSLAARALGGFFSCCSSLRISCWKTSRSCSLSIACSWGTETRGRTDEWRKRGEQMGEWEEECRVKRHQLNVLEYQNLCSLKQFPRKSCHTNKTVKKMWQGGQNLTQIFCHNSRSGTGSYI